MPQLCNMCNDYIILAITMYKGEKTSSSTSTGALAFTNYDYNEL